MSCLIEELPAHFQNKQHTSTCWDCPHNTRHITTVKSPPTSLISVQSHCTLQNIFVLPFRLVNMVRLHGRLNNICWKCEYPKENASNCSTSKLLGDSKSHVGSLRRRKAVLQELIGTCEHCINSSFAQ